MKDYIHSECHETVHGSINVV